MSEVPPDVLHTAQKLCDDLIQAWLLHHSRDEACTFAVKAIMEERQRCVELVKNMAEYEGTDFGLVAYINDGASA